VVVLPGGTSLRWSSISERGDTHESCASTRVVLVVALGGVSMCGVSPLPPRPLCYSLAFPCFVLPRFVASHCPSVALVRCLVVFGWLGWRCWVWFDREGWFVCTPLDDVTMSVAVLVSKGGWAAWCLSCLMTLSSSAASSALHSRPQLLARFPFVWSLTASPRDVASLLLEWVSRP